MKSKKTIPNYRDYLNLDSLLKSQKLISEKRGIWKFDCRAELDNELVCTATILCADRKAK